jgi:hypothetical protein
MYENIRDGFKVIDRDHKLEIKTARDLVEKESESTLLEKMTGSDFFDEYLKDNCKFLGQKGFNPVDLLSVKVIGFIRACFSDRGLCSRLEEFGVEYFLAGGKKFDHKTVGSLKRKHPQLIDLARKWGLKLAELLKVIDGLTFYLDGMKIKAYS